MTSSGDSLDRLRKTETALANAVSAETLRRLREDMRADPHGLSLQLRAGPQQALSQISYLSPIERQNLSMLGRDLHAALVGRLDAQASPATPPPLGISEETLRRLMEDMRADPGGLAKPMRVGPHQTLARIQYLTAAERQALAAHGHGLYDALVQTEALRGPRVPRSIATIGNRFADLGDPFTNPRDFMDRSIAWSQAVDMSILIDEASGVWHTGRVRSIVVTGHRDILVGSEHGGVWVVNEYGGGQPLSHDWPTPDIRSLALGLDGPNHVYAAGSGLHESSPAGSLLSPWFDLTPSLGGTGISTINHVAVISGVVGQRIIVLATNAGLFWSSIPPSSRPRTYSWNRAFFASRDPNHPIAGPVSSLCFGLCVGRTDFSRSARDTVCVSIPGAGLFVGTFGTSGLVMRRPTVFDSNGQRFSDDAIIATTGTVSPSTSRGDRRLMAGAAADDTDPDQKLLMVIRSNDGGQTWRQLAAVVDVGGNTFPNLSDDMGTKKQGGFNNVIAISPSNSDVLVLGWVDQFISTDGGTIWRKLVSPHLHEDAHGLFFEPASESAPETVYLGTDGGVAFSRDILTADTPTWSSALNKRLLILQFGAVSSDIDPPTRENLGGCSASAEVPGFVSGALQDNGIIVARIGSHEPAWRQLDDGDGHCCTFFAIPDLSHRFPVRMFRQVEKALIADEWPYDVAPSVTVLPSRTEDAWVFKNAPVMPLEIARPFVLERIVAPVKRNQANQYMLAVAGGRTQDWKKDTVDVGGVYGFFANDDGTDMHWEQIGTAYAPFPPGGANEVQRITAVASYDGADVIVGTRGGYIEQIHSLRGTHEIMPIETFGPNDVNDNVRISHIRMWSPWDGVASYNNLNTGEGAVLRLQNGVWKWVFIGTKIYGLDVDSYGRIFAATDTDVWWSRTSGAAWLNASLNLPANPRSCDLRFVEEPLTGQTTGTGLWLYLATAGRSLWRAAIPRPPR